MRERLDAVAGRPLLHRHAVHGEMGIAVHRDRTDTARTLGPSTLPVCPAVDNMGATFARVMIMGPFDGDELSGAVRNHRQQAGAVARGGGGNERATAAGPGSTRRRAVGYL